MVEIQVIPTATGSKDSRCLGASGIEYKRHWGPSPVSASAHRGYGPAGGGIKLQEAPGLWMATMTAAAVLAKLAGVNERSYVYCGGQSRGGRAVCTL